MTRHAFLFLALIASLVACNEPPPDVWKQLCVEADRHDFRPKTLNISGDPVIAYRWEFTPSMQYELDGGDQCDWNKLHGVSWNWLNNHDNSFMVAWRWNPAGFWQVGAYYHDEGDTHWASAECSEPTAQETDPAIPVAAIYPGPDGSAQFETHMNFQPNGFAALTIITATETLFFEHFFGVEADNTYREIGPWFGGNRTAPHDMCLKRKRIN